MYLCKYFSDIWIKDKLANSTTETMCAFMCVPIKKRSWIFPKVDMTTHKTMLKFLDREIICSYRKEMFEPVFYCYEWLNVVSDNHFGLCPVWETMHFFLIISFRSSRYWGLHWGWGGSAREGGGRCWMRERATQIQLVFKFLPIFEGMKFCMLFVFLLCACF